MRRFQELMRSNFSRFRTCSMTVGTWETISCTAGLLRMIWQLADMLSLFTIKVSQLDLFYTIGPSDLSPATEKGKPLQFFCLSQDFCPSHRFQCCGRFFELLWKSALPCKSNFSFGCENVGIATVFTMKWNLAKQFSTRMGPQMPGFLHILVGNSIFEIGYDNIRWLVIFWWIGKSDFRIFCFWNDIHAEQENGNLRVIVIYW